MKIVNFPTYNFFYRINEDGVVVERPFQAVTYFNARETLVYKELDELLKQGVITAFGWTTTLPYSTSNN